MAGCAAGPGVTGRTAWRELRFSVRLRHDVLGVRERTGVLIEGPAGWGESSPLPAWAAAERAASLAFAREAAEQPFPAPVRDAVAVNAMVPRLAPEEAAALARASGCGTVKVKVGDPGWLDRLAAVRAAVGPAVRLRLDANGAWDGDAAERELGRAAAYGVELVEDPVASMDDLARLRRRVTVRVAAEMCVRTLDDARRLRRLDAADAVVLKPQRLGGVRAALVAAEAAGVPAIASSALETSVGLCAVLALAAALPESPFAHGVGTALLLAGDVCAGPLMPHAGTLRPRRLAPDLLLAAAAAG